MGKSKTLQDVMGIIAKKYVFKKENYPNMDDSSVETVRAFAINHSVLHMQKTLGKIADVCEVYDHTGKQSLDGLNTVGSATVKMFINTLKLAEEIGISAEQLIAEVDTFFEKR